MQDLNDALLHAEPEQLEPRRGTKDALIHKILRLHEEQGVPLEVSNTKLKRMSKKELAGLLGSMLQTATTSEMARQVGCDPNTATQGTIALGALRMVHDLMANATERIGDPMLQGYGYTITGFKDALTDPTVREATDACLAEIAQDSDVLAYIESPWSRLGLAWMGAAASVARAPRKPVQKQNAGRFGIRFAAVGSDSSDEKNPV